MATLRLERSLLWMKVVLAGGECKGNNWQTLRSWNVQTSVARRFSLTGERTSLLDQRKTLRRFRTLYIWKPKLSRRSLDYQKENLEVRNLGVTTSWNDVGFQLDAALQSRRSFLKTTKTNWSVSSALLFPRESNIALNWNILVMQTRRLWHCDK